MRPACVCVCVSGEKKKDEAITESRDNRRRGFSSSFLSIHCASSGFGLGRLHLGDFCRKPFFLFLRRERQKTRRWKDTKEGGWERQEETRRSVSSVFARVRSAGGERIKVETLLLKFGQCKKNEKREGVEKRKKKRNVSCCTHTHTRAHKAALSLIPDCRKGAV